MKGSLGLLFRDGPFYRRLLYLAVPIASQSLGATLLNFVDTIMIGRLGAESIAAVALGNQLFFLLMVFLFGIGSGAAVFMAQFWGKKDIAGIHSSLGFALLVGLIGATLFTLFIQVAPRAVLAPFQPSEDVAALAVSYLRVVSLSYPAMAITVTMFAGLRSTERVRVPLFVSLLAVALNSVGNYLLIFGPGPFPQLGVYGAALATTGARLIELVVILFVVYLRREPVAASLSRLLRFPRGFLGRYLHTAGPVLLHDIAWALGITAYTVVFSRMGTGVLAAYNVTDTVSRLATVLVTGTASGVAILIGKRIGAGAKGLARVYAVRAAFFSPLFGLLLGVAVFAFSGLIPLLFDVGTEVQATIQSMLSLFPALMVAKVANTHVSIGILRAGGDTRFALVVNIGALWLIGVPAVAIAGLVLRAPVHIVYLLFGLEELLRWLVALFRVRSGRWIHDTTS